MKKVFKFGLKQKLAVTVTAVLALVGGLTAYLSYNLSINSFMEHLEMDVEEFTVNKAEDLSLGIHFFESIIKNLSENPDIASYLNGYHKKQDPVILSHLRHYMIENFVYNIYLMDTDGTVLTSVDPAFTGNNYGFRDYFINALKGNSVIESSLGVPTKQLGYYFSAPVKSSDGDTLGVVVMKVVPDAINRYLNNDGIGEKLDLMIVNDNGIIIHTRKPNRLFQSLGPISENVRQLEILKHFPSSEVRPLQYGLVQSALKDTTRYFSITFNDEEDGENEILSVAKISHYPFYLVIESDLGNYIGSATALADLIVAFVLVGMILTIWVSLLVVSRFIDPLVKLSSFAKKVGLGDYKVKIPNNFSTYELNDLAKAFNEMVDNVRVSRDKIESKVRAQTSEINKKQSILSRVLKRVKNEKNKTEIFARELEKFKLAVDFASDHVVITDKNGSILYANKAVEKITGFKIHDIMGKKAGSKVLWGGLMPEEFYKKLWKTIKVDKKVFSGEVTNKRKNGEIYNALASISPVLNDKNEVVFFVGIERDITKEKEVDRMKTEFISLSSHQLRTPLSAMKWLTEMLLNGDAGELNKQQKDFVHQIFDSNERMIALVNTLLDISKIESGKIVCEPKIVSLPQLVQTYSNEQKEKLAEKKLKFSLNIEKGVKTARTDPKLIGEVYKNLLSNAIKYTPAGGKVALKLYKKGKTVMSEVSDTGLGIPKTEQSRIFGKFFRSSNVVKSETDGNGLGLYLVKSIVETCGGKIGFHSEEGKGTTFWFSLPIKGFKSKKHKQ